MSHKDDATPILDALTYDGQNRFRRVWLMGRASYLYTASYIGNTDPEHEPTFTLLDAIRAGFVCAWDELWRSK